MNTLLKVFTIDSPQSETSFTEAEQALLRTCEYVAQFWSDILRLNLFKTNLQSVPQALASHTNPLNRKLIDRFQQTLEIYIFREISELEHSSQKRTEPNFERWVGCLEYGPNTYLAEVAESLSISPLYFPPQTGCYVYPGRVIGLNGQVRVISDKYGNET